MSEVTSATVTALRFVEVPVGILFATAFVVVVLAWAFGWLTRKMWSGVR